MFVVVVIKVEMDRRFFLESSLVENLPSCYISLEFVAFAYLIDLVKLCSVFLPWLVLVKGHPFG